jgi:hypothetical protein
MCWLPSREYQAILLVFTTATSPSGSKSGLEDKTLSKRQ